MNKKLTIFVACHKPVEVITNDIYIPIHVGRVNSRFKVEMSSMIGDDTGDNISVKNPFYSEMTAQYWVWKNYTASEYIGFCHYRRYFDPNIQTRDIIQKFDRADVLMIEPNFRTNTRIAYASNFISPEDLAIVIKVINKLYPEYNNAFAKYAYGYRDYCLNMFICKRELFNQYAKWIFDILFECEKYIRLSEYSRARRVFGYIAELLMPVFFLHNNKRIETIPYYNSESNVLLHNKILVRIKLRIKELLLQYIINPQYKRIKIIENDQAIEIGLKNDGIKI